MHACMVIIYNNSKLIRQVSLTLPDRFLSFSLGSADDWMITEKSSITNGMYIQVVLIIPINMPQKLWYADTTLYWLCHQTLFPPPQRQMVWQCETIAILLLPGISSDYQFMFWLCCEFCECFNVIRVLVYWFIHSLLPELLMWLSFILAMC